MRYVYGCAMSMDGFIADSHGGVGWLDDFHGQDYGESDYMRGDTLIMGRTTYEHGLKLGWRGEKRKYVVVLSSQRQSGPHVDRFWSGSLRDLDRHLRERSQSVWMMGGGITASSFLEAGLLDEVRVAVMPVVLGSGVPLFGPLPRPVRLQLMRSKSFPDHVVTMNYTVIRP
jgi:dihydrofolate reductase